MARRTRGEEWEGVLTCERIAHMKAGSNKRTYSIRSLYFQNKENMEENGKGWE